MQDLLEKELKNLNQKQLEVVGNIYGPLMVIAGPGTGKTQIIALKIAHILQKTDLNPENILVTTFTDAGVVAIKKRLQKFLKKDASKVNITTFHSFAKEVIDDFPEKFIEKRAQNIIDDIETLEILTSILDEEIENKEIEELFFSTDKYAYLIDIKQRISKLKQEGVTPNKFEIIINNLEKELEEEVLELVNNKKIRDLDKRQTKDREDNAKYIKKLRELNLVYKNYQKEILKRGLYDFSDMILYVVEKFKDDKDILAYYAEKYQFIMIDEFQDSNNSQNTIVDLIMDYNKDFQNITVVGDDDQSIYRFQGANIENMLDFTLKYKDSKKVVLEQNYRSSQDILDLSKNLIENNQERITNRVSNIEKKLIASGEFASLKENYFCVLENDIKEKFFVYDEIIKRDISKNTIAIIVKTNSQVVEWSNFMTQKGLNVISKNNKNILNNHFVNLILDFLNFIVDPYFNDEKLLNFLRSDLCKIENIDALFISRALYNRNYSREKFPLSIWDILSNLDDENNKFVKENAKNFEKINEFTQDILNLSTKLSNYSLQNFLGEVIDYLDIYNFVENYGNFDDLQDVFSLINKIKTLSENNKDLNLKQVLFKFDLYKKYNLPILREAIYNHKSNVEILTAHSSKGLEYDYVFIPDVSEGNWNKKMAGDKLKLPFGISGDGIQFANTSKKEAKEIIKNMAKEEERRLFFVALTRAKKGLILTRPMQKDGKLKLDSAFVLETNIPQTEIKYDLDEKEAKKYLINNISTKKLNTSIDDELLFIEDFLKTYKLSPTDLNRFLDDPKAFLHGVIYKYPFLSNENLVFGTAYHAVLEKAYIAKSAGKLPTLKEMQDLFIDKLKKFSLTQTEFERLLKRGLDGLLGYYPIFVANKREVLAVEVNFRFQNIEFENIPLTGKIDKIEIIGESFLSGDFDGQGSLFSQKVALVDYKTGKVKTIGSIKGLDKDGNKKLKEGGYARQLMFYKLMFGLSSKYSTRYQVDELALDFVEGKDEKYLYSKVLFTDEEFEFFKDELRDSWEKINNLEFWREILEGS